MRFLQPYAECVRAAGESLTRGQFGYSGVLNAGTGREMKNQPFFRRLEDAVHGLGAAFKTEASLRAQLLLGAAAAAVLVLLRPPIVWVALCVVSAALVLGLELVNTALEHLADHLHPGTHEAIRVAKDCAAAAVLIASAAAAVIGMLTVAVSLGWI